MSKKILIIEDEVAMAEMYRDKFQNAGYEVFLAITSEEGMKLAKKEKPDLIVLDILLPTENGISFLGRLRKDPELKNLRVVALSNYDEPKTRREAHDLGVEEYLIKTDYAPRDLVVKVKTYLGE